MIKELEESRADANRLAELKAELEKINKRKAEYVAEHPEARRLVYRRRKQGEPEPELPTKKARNLFDKNGLPRHPERSIYYDPVMNPYGVAPPGMPYAERRRSSFNRFYAFKSHFALALLPGEIDSDVDSEGMILLFPRFFVFDWQMVLAEDAVPLPGDLPPGTELVTSDDDISMPDDPPPGKPSPADFSQATIVPTLPVLPPPPPPPPPLGIPAHFGSVPAGFPPWNTSLPQPPPGFQTYNLPLSPLPPPIPRQQNPSSVQDPLSSLPHQTFQAHRASQLFPPPSQPSSASIPSHPSLPPKPTTAAQMAAATIEGAPELRDLKKEATAFIPTAVKRKKVQSATVAPPLPDDE